MMATRAIKIGDLLIKIGDGFNKEVFTVEVAKTVKDMDKVQTVD